MEHLDLAGVINTPPLWNMPAFDQQEAIYLSSSRQMLEPILEETSEDEEHAQNSWNQYEQSREHVWSSTESETGSVIRIEITKDPDSISERDFACPAKRARRSEDFIIGGQLAAAAAVQANTQHNSSATQQPLQPPIPGGSYDDSVLQRRPQRSSAGDYSEANSNSLERFLAYEACTRGDSWGQPTTQQQPVLQQRNSTGSRHRFDDFSDSDSISYHSLSRSSSLIQFESLERQLQLQEQHASMSSLVNSSPSLLSFDGARSSGALNADAEGVGGGRSGANSGNNSGNNSRRGSQSSLLKRFESSDGRLHQTYLDLDKLDFDDEQRVLFGSASKTTTNLMEATVGEVRSDSESSTSSSSNSSGNSILTTSKPSAEDLTDSSGGTHGITRAGRIIAFQQRGGKNSAENLSEDSGYCEPSTLRRAKSKSIPKNFEKFCEEEEEFQQQYDYGTEDRHQTQQNAEDVDCEMQTTTTTTYQYQQQQQQQQQLHSKNVINDNHKNMQSDVAASTQRYVFGHDICEPKPKINDATFIVSAEEEDGETVCNAPNMPPSPPHSSKLPPHRKIPSTNNNQNVGAQTFLDENEFCAREEMCEAEHYNDYTDGDDDVDTESIAACHVSNVCPRFERAKNSPTCEVYTTVAAFLEQRRTMAHSPSPVASDISAASSNTSSAASGSSFGTARSSTSASTCASAASFTWLPTTANQLQQQQHQLQLEREQWQAPSTSEAYAKSELLASLEQRNRSTTPLENFCTSLRNSLPDIRDAFSSTICVTVLLETNFPISTEDHKGSTASEAKCDDGALEEHVRKETTKNKEEGEESELLLVGERLDGGGATISTYHLDDSDISTTSPAASGSASSARESHSDETDNEFEKAVKKQIAYKSDCCDGADGSGRFSERCSDVSVGIGYVSSGRRILSVPSELNKLGRKKRVNTRYRQSKSSPEEEEADTTNESSASTSSVDEAEDDFFDAGGATTLKIRRSCSWSERRERNLQRFEAAFGNRPPHRQGEQGSSSRRQCITQSLGYMNVSYQDLTQLDYSGKQRERENKRIVDAQQSNLKRGNMDTPKSTTSTDYDAIICKGNFLLDELSQIYDRNASILNDKPMEVDEELLLPKSAELIERPSCSPRPPPRQRKHSHSSYSDLDSMSGGGSSVNEQVDGTAVQHVQLTIRQPPARQKHTRKSSENTQSMITDTQLFAGSETPTTNTSPSVSYGKTFDQDPTNLRTSYAQSLEKCNFYAKELSNAELNQPTSNSLAKRRFHSQANVTKQRNMVSSTPNLNAYDPHGNELDDDIYVCSAHTSMHQLPQTITQKPLGILLPAGSRTSFSKEVSFCPVVSQYSWQEQSSEEYNEQHQQQSQSPEPSAVEQAMHDKPDEETDDELLDNADATVIQNTRVNEMIAARYAADVRNALTAGNAINAANKSLAQLKAVPIENVRALLTLREQQSAEEQGREYESERAYMQERVGNAERDERVENVEKTSHKATTTQYNAETKGEALKLDSNPIDDNTPPASETSETSNANASVSQKSTIIEAATNVVEAEQSKTKTTTKVNTANRLSNFSVVNEASECGADSNDNASDFSYNDGNQTEQQTRPLSLHLPILSEPPINRAHHILYASQQLLDNFERRESEQYDNFLYQKNNGGSKCVANNSALVGVGVADRRTKSVNNLSAAQTATRYRMSNATAMSDGGHSGNGGAAAEATNNNNELLNKKFKDEKHPNSKGFLSRFAHGLRFSLRRKNKKQLQQQKEQQQQQQQLMQSESQIFADKSTMRKSFGKSLPLPQMKEQQQQQKQLQLQQQQQQQQQQQLSPTEQNNKSKSRKTAQSGPDFIYIPLKGPIPPPGTQPPPSTATAQASGGNLQATNEDDEDDNNATQIGTNGGQNISNNNNSNNNNNTNSNSTRTSISINSSRSGDDKNDMRAITDKNGEPLVTGKPPKPYRYGSIPATTSSTTIITKYFGSGRRREGGGGGAGTPAHAQKGGTAIPTPNAANFKSRSQFYTDFLDAERAYYADDEIEKQLNANVQANGYSATDALSVNAQNITVNTSTNERGDYIVEYEIPSGGKEVAQIAYSNNTPGVARETVMLLTTGGNGVAGAGSGANGRAGDGVDIAPSFTTLSSAYLHHTNGAARIGLIETNLDTHETVISGKTRSLVDIVDPQQQQQQQQRGGGVGKRLNMSAVAGNADLRLDGDGDGVLAEEEHEVRIYGRDGVGGGRGGAGGAAVVIKSTTANGSQIASVRRPHKSMEFLLDKENQKNVLPPENELQKSHDHNPAALSEHQLRVQASLQRLNIPDWFRQYNQNTSRSPDGAGAGGANNTTTSSIYKPGNFTRKRTTESGRWAGLNSKTTSLSSLGSQRSDRSPLLLSPSAHSHHGGQVVVGGAGHQQQHNVSGGGSVYGAGSGAGTFSRWSTSHLNSSQTSPSVSQRGSFTRGAPINSSFISVASGQSSVIRSSYRQPYLGWRSQEKLSQRTAHERLASSLLAQQQQQQQQQRTTPPSQRGGGGGSGKLQPPVTPEIQSSIKEVTSAIVHFVNDQTQQQQQQQRSRSTSPNSRKCWLESSFVGIRPLDLPQTPVIETSVVTAFSSATNNNSSISSSQYSNYNSSTNTLTAITTPSSLGGIGSTTAITTNPHALRMNGLSIVGGALERSLSNASLEDVLASLLGLPSASSSAASERGGVQQSVNVNVGAGAGAATTSDPYATITTRSAKTTGDSASQSLVTFRHMPQQLQQPPLNPQSQAQLKESQKQLLLELQAEQQRLRRRSEGDAPQQQKQQQQQQIQQQQQLNNRNVKNGNSSNNEQRAPTAPHASAGNSKDNGHASTTTTISGAGGGGCGGASGSSGVISAGHTAMPTRRVSLGDSSESNNKTNSKELPIKCRNTKCDRSATSADAKKYYKSCHNCTHLYCSRECRRAHWEKHRKACLHSRASNLCRQVLATCKDDMDTQRHLSLLARKGYLSQGRGVVRVLFRSAEAAESFIKHGFQCMGEASYVRWPDLMPAEMGLELYSELLKLSTEYKPDSKMLIYVAICVVSEAPGMGQAPVRWERQLVSRCAKLKLCKSILAELEQQQQQQQQQQALQQQQQHQQQKQQTQQSSHEECGGVSGVDAPTTEILILTFNPNLRSNANQGELILSNILDILSRRGVLLRKHYPEVYQRLQTYTDGQTDKFNPVTLHPRDSHTGKSFVCIIMPVHTTDSDGVIKLPSISDGGNRVTTIDVGSPAALAELDDDELLTRTTS